MDFNQDDINRKKGAVERYNWMGWLFTIVGIVIMVLLMLMFLELGKDTNFNNTSPETSPAVQIEQPAISHSRS